MPRDKAKWIRTRKDREAKRNMRAYRVTSHEQAQAGIAALRMISDAIAELFGPIATLESEEESFRRGPQLHHRAEAIIQALQNVASSKSKKARRRRPTPE